MWMDLAALTFKCLKVLQLCQSVLFTIQQQQPTDLSIKHSDPVRSSGVISTGGGVRLIHSLWVLLLLTHSSRVMEGRCSTSGTLAHHWTQHQAALTTHQSSHQDDKMSSYCNVFGYWSIQLINNSDVTRQRCSA